MPAEVERKLAAILLADVVGYSRLMAADEASAVERLKASRDLIGGLVRQHAGRVVDAVADNLLAELRPTSPSQPAPGFRAEMEEMLLDENRLLGVARVACEAVHR